jgi:Na+/proline symporter/signal transduction histidine kinase
MLQTTVVVLTSFAYLGLLFAIAFYADKRAEGGRSLIANPYVYSLSLAVYCTTWTFYGSVGRAASTGIGFLPIYLGPTLMVALWWFVMRKIIRISKVNRITSIADFIASRYGKSQMLGGFVTIIAVIGVVPYIALQLKAVSSSFTLLVRYPDVVADKASAVPVLGDTTLVIAMVMAAFTIFFGARQLDVTERHEGMVAAIAFESVVKLVAFVAVGLFVTYGVYDGFSDLFNRASLLPEAAKLSQLAGEMTFGTWASLTFVSMLSIMLLPRQFQIAVVENVSESHLRKATWLFPLYLLAINVFVLPIAIGGMLQFPGGSVDADTFVLTLPMAHQQQGLALFAFIGGLSAATGMVIVETIALSTMVCNDLVMPLLLRIKRLRLAEHSDLSFWLLSIRRAAIVLVMLFGYAYFRLAGEAYALVSIGLISFVAVAQFAPSILGGIYWKEGTKAGATAGLLAGFLVWLYTLLLPSFAKSGWLGTGFVENGFLEIALLKPQQLFGLQGLDEISHCIFWSMLANVGLYIGVSLLGRQSAGEHGQATLFVDVFKSTVDVPGSRFWRGSASLPELFALAQRFLGPSRSERAFASYARKRGVKNRNELKADAALVSHVEILLAGSIGAASARAMVSSVVKEEPLSLLEVMGIVEESSQAIAYSRKLEQKSHELETATANLTAANERLKELDRLKDDFISTVTHELRTPLTSIRAFSEILRDNPDLEPSERRRFLGIVVKESERLTRLINQVLDAAKLESGNVEWKTERIDLAEVIEEAVNTTAQMFKEKQISVHANVPSAVPKIAADRDRLMQVLLNLLSNAAKFCPAQNGVVEISLNVEVECVRVGVHDNGIGICVADQEVIFEKFRQVGDMLTEKPQGTGLGLSICRQIIRHFNGKLWVESAPAQGASFFFSLPVALPVVAAIVPGNE